ncbi:MAG: cytochrome c maturation protein CcmE [Anaerolineae bacterium]|nr:cytochrome c maturation protein CcmE [Anaerolineae bacterium]
MTSAPANWEKSTTLTKPQTKNANRLKFGLVTVVLLSAIAFLMFSGTQFNGRFFITVDDVLSRPDLVGKSVKISGAVIGDTIKVDPDTQTITFTIAHVTDKLDELEKDGGLAKVLHEAVISPNAKHISVVVRNQPRPDLLQNEAQAILTGKMGEDGVFYADELNLKCPSKYQGDLPSQSEASS